MTENNMLRHETCELCGEGDARLIEVMSDVPIGSGASAELLSVRTPVWKCDTCAGQYLHEDADMIQHDAVCDHLDRLRPSAIRSLRLLFGMNPETFSAYTGIGIASIKRWESGAQIQTKAFDNLLRFYKKEAEKNTVHQIDYSKPKFRTHIPEDRIAASKSFKLAA
ncbi:hypothetical protein [Altererythrobacter lutimaris]|uniref:YgiT-type zinc finger protein n=1 Tax=Altererythrobacter lutimaris TaxID=2743979 RepID=A0A850HA72_9SPHN|nr:hypothetical protein [Altererythrobacter lutimaris]NVE93851.1 hypothetical protein [Altererythrobacter lutimaris]